MDTLFQGCGFPYLYDIIEKIGKANNQMVLYCKKCGYVFGEGYVPRLVEKGICPVCKNKLYKTQEGTNYFRSRIERSMPTWEDVVRHKYLKNITLDTETSERRSNIEQKKQQDELRKLKGNSSKTEEKKFIPKCPTCQSANIKRISGTSKVFSVAMFGLFSQKVKKTFHCNNCGYEW